MVVTLEKIEEEFKRTQCREVSMIHVRESVIMAMDGALGTGIFCEHHLIRWCAHLEFPSGVGLEVWPLDT